MPCHLDKLPEGHFPEQISFGLECVRKDVDVPLSVHDTTSYFHISNREEDGVRDLDGHVYALAMVEVMCDAWFDRPVPRSVRTDEPEEHIGDGWKCATRIRADGDTVLMKNGICWVVDDWNVRCLEESDKVANTSGVALAFVEACVEAFVEACVEACVEVCVEIPINDGTDCLKHRRYMLMLLQTRRETERQLTEMGHIIREYEWKIFL